MSVRPMSTADLLRETWIVVLAWNGWNDTRECLASLQPLAPRGVRVLVVDNGSTDGTPRLTRAEFPWCEVLENGANLGFAAGNNAGIRYAMARGARFVLLLNNDTVVDERFAEALLDAAAAWPDVGFACSKIYFAAQPERIWFAGARFDSFTGRSRHVGYGELDRGQFDEVGEIERPCGCAVLVTRRLLDEVGLMAEELFAYGDDVEWMLRARRRGFRAILVPESKVWHKVSKSTGGPAASSGVYYGVRNTLYILDRHFPLRWRAARWARIAAVTSVHLASILTMRLAPASALRRLWQGLTDYSRGRMGPMPEGAPAA